MRSRISTHAPAEDVIDIIDECITHVDRELQFCTAHLIKLEEEGEPLAALAELRIGN